MAKQEDGGRQQEAERVAKGESPFRLSEAEVEYLDAFLEGAVMDPGTRRHMRRSWGFCSRHAWAHAVMDLEVRQGRPADVVVLHEDLVGRAADIIQRQGLPWKLARWRLRTRDACLACTQVAALRRWPPTEQLMQTLDFRTAKVNRMERTKAKLLETRAAWAPRACPRCMAGDGATCRPHMLEDAEPNDRDALTAYLADLHSRLGAFAVAMWAPKRADLSLRSSWVEAVGWVAGWWLPALVVV